MKKILGILMVMALVLSCAKESFYEAEAPTAAQKGRIVFSAGTNTVTRAVINRAEDMDGGTIGVYCCVDDVAPADGKDYMNNVPVTKTSQYWTADSNYYWVNGKSMRFFAYYPYDAATVRGTGADAEKIKVAVDLGQDAKNVDLLYAFKDSTYMDTLYNQAGAYTADDIKDVIVPLNFRHAFAQIAFDAKAGTKFSQVTIDSLWFEIPNTQGNFEITTTAGAESFDFVGTGGGTRYDYANKEIVRTNSNNYADFTKIDSVIVLPQSSNVNVVIKYTAKVLGIPYTQRRKVVNLKDVTPLDPKSSDDTANEWKAGYKYIYHIIIDPADIIKFSVSVSDWSTAGEGGHWTIL